MIKSFLIILGLNSLLFSEQQILLVVAEEYNSTKAKLYCYEDEKTIFAPIEVNLGAKGLAWGLGEKDLFPKVPALTKKEGDKKAPAGIFRLTKAFGYHDYANIKIPYMRVSKEIICVDDNSSDLYNRIIKKTTERLPASYEDMRRDDSQYEFGIVVAHNDKGEKGMGSCIFMHVEKSPNTPSAGCTTMQRKDIKNIIEWLDEKKKPLLIQIQKDSLGEIEKLYPMLKKHRIN